MAPRTSITDPLKIDAMPCGNGVIGMTLCPGKQASSVFGAAWARDLALDLDAVVDWGATSLVSLVERPELSALGVSNLGDAAEEAGLEWHHLPIKDVDIPDERFEGRWTYSGHVLQRRLQSGERIVLHCRGGLGRTGTIAARLAIELGETPQQRYAASDRPGKERSKRTNRKRTFCESNSPCRVPVTRTACLGACSAVRWAMHSAMASSSRGSLKFISASGLKGSSSPC
ncbi:hypothetical protein [Candidatus Rariloculus sp.]|uniref:phosphatase domain-containing putative toxin n=1 Tax=Candidatus Rariloculus sp. TaxID=3101265 RepID=UPI003D0DFFFA